MSPRVLLAEMSPIHPGRAEISSPAMRFDALCRISAAPLDDMDAVAGSATACSDSRVRLLTRGHIRTPLQSSWERRTNLRARETETRSAVRGIRSRDDVWNDVCISSERRVIPAVRSARPCTSKYPIRPSYGSSPGAGEAVSGTDDVRRPGSIRRSSSTRLRPPAMGPEGPEVRPFNSHFLSA